MNSTSKTTNLLRTIALAIAMTAAGGNVVAVAAEAAGGHAKHTPAVAEGVTSMDVYAEGGRIHLLIVRQDGDDQTPPTVQYLRSTDGHQWSDPVTIANDDLPPPVGARRGMDVQLVAAGDRVVAGWTVYNAEHRFGRGKIATAVSADGGKTWSVGPNPADDNSEGDHAFLDLAADDRGTFHAVWLDARSGKKGLIYANSTDGGSTWSKNMVIDGESCECCWNAITTAGDSVMVLYRNKDPRDMAMIRSDDRGKTWSSPVPVGKFDWAFDGCPHVGGGLAAPVGDKSHLLATVWTGQSEAMGAYVLTSSDKGQSWGSPIRLDREGNSRRSDVAAAGRKAVVAWDALVDGKGVVFASTSTDGGTTWSPPERLSAAGTDAAYPRVVPAGQGLCVLWTESSEGKSTAWRSKGID